MGSSRNIYQCFIKTKNLNFNLMYSIPLRINHILKLPLSGEDNFQFEFIFYQPHLSSNFQIKCSNLIASNIRKKFPILIWWGLSCSNYFFLSTYSTLVNLHGKIKINYRKIIFFFFLRKRLHPPHKIHHCLHFDTEY